MNRNRPSNLSAAAVVVGLIGLLIVVPAAYVSGYLLGSEALTRRSTRERIFSAAWQVTLYRPAARAESDLIGMPVALGHWEFSGTGEIVPFAMAIGCCFGDDCALEEEL